MPDKYLVQRKQEIDALIAVSAAHVELVKISLGCIDVRVGCTWERERREKGAP